jgi:hypothetical protein
MAIFMNAQFGNNLLVTIIVTTETLLITDDNETCCAMQTEYSATPRFGCSVYGTLPLTKIIKNYHKIEDTKINFHLG